MKSLGTLLNTHIRWAVPFVLVGPFMLAVAPAHAVGTRHFVLESAKDFEGGKTEGVFVDSLGALRPGLALTPTPLENTPVVWAAQRTKDGLLLGTGNEGKLLAFQGGKVTTVADADALAVSAIVEAWGRTFVATVPSGEILEYRAGRLIKFAKLGDSLIWGLAFDAKTNSLFAATGPEGQLYRVASDGAAEVYFDAEESHLVSVAAEGGAVYAGSSNKARLYRVSAPGRAEVLRDFGKTEVRAIAVQKSGTILCIVNELKGSTRADGWKSDRPAPATSSDATKGSGELYRFLPDGRAETLLESKDDFFSALAVSADGEPLVGTGVDGRVIAVRPRLESRQIANLDERQVSAIFLGPMQRGLVVTSDPGVVYDVSGLGSRHGNYTSAALDAGLRARFGKVRLDASPGVEVQFRSGNTAEPGQYWSDWSPRTASGEEPKVPPGRYLQFRATMPEGPDRVLRRIEIPFRTDNLRATLQKISAESPSLAKGSRGLKSSGGPIEGAPSPKLRLSFDVDNPDEDELHYLVEYAMRGTDRWFSALSPGDVLTKNTYTWDTSALAEGEYRLRVTVSDDLANDPTETERHSLESGLVLVDNTPPQLSGFRFQAGTLAGVVSDGVGPIRRVEVRVDDAKEWLPLSPLDGILDEPTEEFRVKWTPEQIRPGDTLTLRAFDSALNSTVQIVQVVP